MQPIWVTPFSLSELNRRAKLGLSAHLEIEFVDFGPNHLTARMPVAPFTMQPMNSMHGGASAALAETVASVAANYCVDQTNSFCVGLELNINHLRAVQSGWIDATARPLHLGKRTQVWEIKITDTQQKLIAASRLTVSVIQKKV